LDDRAGTGLGHPVADRRARLAAWQRFGVHPVCRGANAQLVWALPPPGAMLRAAGGSFSWHAAVGGVRHLRPTRTTWTAASRRFPDLRAGCLTVLKPLLTRRRRPPGPTLGAPRQAARPARSRPSAGPRWGCWPTGRGPP